MTRLDDKIRSLQTSRFIISCPARSGSTMLVHLLRSHPDVLCHGEVFGDGRIGHIAGQYAEQRQGWGPAAEEALLTYSEARPEAFLYDVVFDAQGRRTVGFKFKTDEAFDPRYRAIQDLVRRDLGIRVVHLRRRNLLDQYVSLQVVHKQTGMTLLKEGEKRPEIRAMQVDIPEMLRFFADVLQRERMAQEAYADHEQVVVDYEDLVDPEHEARVRLQRFLGLEPQALSTPTRKIIDDNQRLVEGLDGIFDALAARGLAHRATAEAAAP